MQEIYVEYRKMIKQSMMDRSGRTYEYSELFSKSIKLNEIITSDINGILKIDSFIKLFLNTYELSGYKLMKIYINKVNIFNYEDYDF